jgi:hypothetical protein
VITCSALPILHDALLRACMNAAVQPLCQHTCFLQACKLTCAMCSAVLQLPMRAPELLQQPEVSTCLQPRGTSAQCLLHDLEQLFLRVNAVPATPVCRMVTLCACAASPGPGLAILLTRTWPPMTHACCVIPCRWCCGDMNHLDLGRRAFQEVGNLPCIMRLACLVPVRTMHWCH